MGRAKRRAGRRARWAINDRVAKRRRLSRSDRASRSRHRRQRLDGFVLANFAWREADSHFRSEIFQMSSAIIGSSYPGKFLLGFAERKRETENTRLVAHGEFSHYG